MKILAIESSACCASAAIVEEGKVWGEFFGNTRLTHSQTLLPMVEALLQCTAIPLAGIDAFAVAAGPGSFTGLRIGVAAVKGLARAQDKPCLPVSTLEAMAWGEPLWDGLICGVMDARCKQVYTALFSAEGQKIQRLTPDEAISLDALRERLKGVEKSVVLVGDGAELCYNEVKELPHVALAAPQSRFQRAAGVGMCACELWKQGGAVSAQELSVSYLRLPQAERELKKKLSRDRLP
ncbi:tRNA (adenosine(37)-N6)-threonylcarbamoyltransferase complex dimerization subunit type 1 TsaB [Zongyangia hominis]|uniref:tRNA (Adenosine(37)-N6)-threonylcarbamoyltransferase complex dimerization subunit type 1 TsaB n=1 Tax=Zongyangia hominis TaxID=2763677 RepID=A0A926EE60_9FIRM|nr:tRNA (adenosine(37)-N6)-threonylcarbamoyltransferase complex dimerization subunit type 1 TsaB [Zongyangia hominis]MBC8570769.1 tRNA (adenosine(37)-N6)-threonylcarbamoyltransferase complex dimerization subunit type 1 TsaB [Zongyangia hominis]